MRLLLLFDSGTSRKDLQKLLKKENKLCEKIFYSFILYEVKFGGLFYFSNEEVYLKRKHFYSFTHLSCAVHTGSSFFVKKHVGKSIRMIFLKFLKKWIIQFRLVILRLFICDLFFRL